VCRVRRAFATVTAIVGLAAALPGPAAGGAPVPWCGGTPSAVDRLPDATPGFAVHVLYVRPPGAPDRFPEWAPRLAGDAAEIESWWRGQDPARSPRFDLFAAPGCAGSFGALDISSVELTAGISSINVAFEELWARLTELGFAEAEKAYLAYYDGPTGQSGNQRVCGQGASPTGRRPGFAVVYLDSCGASTGDTVRSVVAVHELMHVFGAVSRSAPHHCSSGHVCDSTSDLMAALLTGSPLGNHLLDVTRDDYYGHAGGWNDVQDSLFLERLDGNDRTPPTTPTALRIGEAAPGVVRLSWRASQDDVGPVDYRLYRDGVFLGETTSTTAVLPEPDDVSLYSVRALDPVGHLSPPASGRFRFGAGMVDESGRLVLDTVRPPQVERVTVRKTKTTSTLTWPAVRDAGGIRSYRVRIGPRTVIVRKPAVALARARVTGAVTIAAVDRAGNVGPALVVPRSRVR
jgi:hypothetical protein